MSIEAVAWALRQDVDDHIAKLLLIALADHHNASTGLCCPRRSLISQMARCDDSTTKRKLRLLADMGLLVAVARYSDLGAQLSNGYLLLMGGAQAAPPSAIDDDGASIEPEEEGPGSRPVPRAELCPPGGAELCAPPRRTAAPPRTVIRTKKKEARALAASSEPVEKRLTERCTETLDLMLDVGRSERGLAMRDLAAKLRSGGLGNA